MLGQVKLLVVHRKRQRAAAGCRGARRHADAGERRNGLGGDAAAAEQQGAQVGDDAQASEEDDEHAKLGNARALQHDCRRTRRSESEWEWEG